MYTWRKKSTTAAAEARPPAADTPAPFATTRDALYAFGTDGYFACPIRRMANAVAARGGPAYRYLFSPTLSNPTRLILPDAPTWAQQLFNRWLGSFHGSNEILFWNTSDLVDPANVALGRRLVQHWASFVKTGAPLAPWPAVGGGAAEDGATHERFYRFGSEGDAAHAGWHQAQCAALAPLDFVWNPPTLSGGPYRDESPPDASASLGA